LAQLNTKGGIPIARVGKLLGISKLQAQEIVESLRELDFLSIVDQEDGASESAFITESGQKCFRELTLQIEPILDGILGDKRHLVRTISAFFALLLQVSPRGKQ
jgi:predicted transcriptional regulator